MKPIWEQGEAKGQAEGSVILNQLLKYIHTQYIITQRDEYSEIVYMFKKSSRQPFRPTLEPNTNDLSPALLHLVKDCWSETPTERPKMDTVRSLLQSMNTGKFVVV